MGCHKFCLSLKMSVVLSLFVVVGVVYGQSCVDVSGWTDEKGYSCADWQNDNCLEAVSFHSYTKAGEEALLDNCCATCAAQTAAIKAGACTMEETDTYREAFKKCMGDRDCIGQKDSECPNRCDEEDHDCFEDMPVYDCMARSLDMNLMKDRQAWMDICAISSDAPFFDTMVALASGAVMAVL